MEELTGVPTISRPEQIAKIRQSFAIQTFDEVERAEVVDQASLIAAEFAVKSLHQQLKNAEKIKKELLAPFKNVENYIKRIFLEETQKATAQKESLSGKISAFLVQKKEEESEQEENKLLSEIFGLPVPDTQAKIVKTGVMRKTWSFTITNENEVPRGLCSPDPVKIRKFIAQFEKQENPPVVAGIEFITKESYVTR